MGGRIKGLCSRKVWEGVLVADQWLSCSITQVNGQKTTQGQGAAQIQGYKADINVLLWNLPAYLMYLSV